MKMIDDVIIIGIDSGYGNIKTANCCFPASVSVYDKEPVFKENLLAYITQCKALSLYDTGVTAEYGDRLITLSTCEYSRKNGRMVVVAKRIALPSAEVGSDA